MVFIITTGSQQTALNIAASKTEMFTVQASPDQPAMTTANRASVAPFINIATPAEGQKTIQNTLKLISFVNKVLRFAGR